MDLLDPRPELWKLPRYEPGRASEVSGAPPALLASNENAWGPSPAAVRAAQEAALSMHRYPDPGGQRLTSLLAERFHLQPEQIMLGDGADQLIRLLALAYLSPGNAAVIPRPSFQAYNLAVTVAGGLSVPVPLSPTGAVDPMRLAGAVSSATRIVFICSPNNPTGPAVPFAALRDAVEKLRSRPLLVVVDEAYQEFADDGSAATAIDLVRQNLPVVVLRTFSKAYGLAGLRIGWAAAPKPVIDVLTAVREPFSVNRIALAAAEAALLDPDHLQRVVAAVGAARRRFLDRATALGLVHYQSQANFATIKAGAAGPEVAALFAAEGVMVRATEPFGLARHLRVTMGTDDEMQRFWAAFPRVDEQAPFPRR
jgi:histidinol-phosphate aminotransferase